MNVIKVLNMGVHQYHFFMTTLQHLKSIFVHYGLYFEKTAYLC